jgi:type IV secretion system protein VirB10
MKVAICLVIISSRLQADGIDSAAQSYVVDPGVKIPLSLMNTISSKQAAEGDRVYLETMYPVLVNGKIVIPPGSYVAGTVTQVKRPGRIKGKGELYLRFDSMILPNGVTRDFKARVGGLEGGASNELDRSEGKIKGDSDKGGDVQTVAQGAQLGTMVGGIAGAAGGRPLSGLGMGAAGGAAAGLAGVLLTRGPDVVLQKGTMLEMVVDRPLTFKEPELDFSNVVPTRPTRVIAAPAEESSKSRSRWPLPF